MAWNLGSFHRMDVHFYRFIRRAWGSGTSKGPKIVEALSALMKAIQFHRARLRKVTTVMAAFCILIGSLPAQNTSPSPGNASPPSSDFKVQKLLPPLKDGKPPLQQVEVHICNAVENPRAVLVLCANAAGLVALEKLTKGTEWKAFAEAQQLGLVVLTFAHDRKADKIKHGYRADEWIGEWLLACVDYYYGQSCPLLLYGESRGGTFAASFVNWRPERVKAWGAFTNQWFEKPVRSKVLLPGIVAFDAEDESSKDEFGGNWYFKAGRKLEKPLLEMKVTTPLKRRKEKMGAFAREFFTSTLNDNPKTSPIWIALRNKKKAATELMSNPTEVVWLPNPSLQGPWETMIGPQKVDPEDELPPVIERSVLTNNPLQPELRFFLRMPPGKGGGEVDGVFAFCSWEGKREQILKKLQPDAFQKIEIGNTAGLKDLISQLIAFAERNNFAVLTWETAQVWSLKPSYYEAKEEEDREANFEAMASAWEAGVDALAKETGIPNTGYFMFGISRGAQWAHRLALRKPERFIAVQFHVASTFDKPTPEAARLLWLISTGEREVGYRNGDASRFYDECRKLNYPVLFKASKGLGHDDNLEISQLREGFFTYALSIRDKMHERNLEKPSDVALEELNAAPWVGDYTTYKVVPSTASNEIPSANRVPLPTADFVKAWSGRPAPNR